MASVGLSLSSPLGSNAVGGGPAAATVDSAVLAAVEARLNEFQVALAIEQERRVKAECVVQELSGQVRELMEKMGCDTVAETRCVPQLMPQMYHTMPPADQSDPAYHPMLPADQSDPAYQPMLPADQSEPVAYQSLVLQTSTHATLLDRGSYIDLADAQKAGMEFEYADLPPDMWGVAIMTLTRDLADIMAADDIGPHLTRFVFAMSMVAMNMILQLAILYWVNLYVVGESVWNIQGNYAQFHHDLFDTKGNFLSEKWADWKGPRDSLCGAVLTKSAFLSVILFLWSGRMMGELKTCRHIWNDLSALPAAPHKADHRQTVIERDDMFAKGEHGCAILATGGCVRFALYTLVILPKLSICLVLWGIGLRWLTATTSFPDLILNALALEFVIDIDEHILEYFLPSHCAASVASTKFAYPKKEAQTPVAKLQVMRQDYVRNIFYLCVVVTVTVVYLKFGQQVLPYYPFDVGEHCGRWFEERFEARCKPLEKNCFPFGDVKEPHRYGEFPAQ